MLEQNLTLSKRAKVKESQKEIHDKISGTFMKVLSAEAYSKHGYKPSCVIFDELHAQPNRDLWDIMTFGSGSARFQPVWIVLTTAGDDPDRGSIGWEIHEKANKILQYRIGNTEGNYDNPVWLPIIYGLGDLSPEEAKDIDIYDEDLWYQCNPSLGKTIEIDTLRQEALDAKQSEYSERLFRWLRLNQWISIKAVGWLPLTLYDANEAPIPDLRGKRCYPGLDLSTTTDLTSLDLVFPPQEGLPYWYTLFVPWITEEKMRERSKRDHVDFERWVKDGYVKTTPGDCIDFDFVEAEIYRVAKDFDLKIMGVDPYLSRMLSQHVMKEDIDVVEIPQDMKNLSPAMKEMEKLFLKGELKHEKNPCARWCFGNVRVATDGNEIIKPMKNKSIGRIDVTVAWIIAMATALLNEKPNINDTILSDDWSM
jgi:phage terminase large subunit-like protein